MDGWRDGRHGRMGQRMDVRTKSRAVGNHRRYGTATFDVVVVINKGKNQRETGKNVGFV